MRIVSRVMVIYTNDSRSPATDGRSGAGFEGVDSATFTEQLRFLQMYLQQYPIFWSDLIYGLTVNVIFTHMSVLRMEMSEWARYCQAGRIR